MGLWNFVKKAGKSIGIGSAEAAEAPPTDVLEAELRDLGLETEGVTIAVEGDKVVLSGAAPSAEVKEKVILALGNVAGVAAVEESITTPDPAPEPLFHEVKKGDNLWKIAEKHLGKGTRHTEIFEANRPMLSHPDKIYPGQILRIPQG
jgi:nucleoid-associated protein YgaU